MKSNELRILAFVLPLLSILSMSVTATVIDLVDQYDYDYYYGSINITNFADFLSDSNSDGINDTLHINLTTQPFLGNSTYIFIVDVFDGDSVSRTMATQSVSQTNNVVSVSTPTRTFSSSSFNYSTEIREVDGTLLYNKFRMQTNNYSNYDTGNSISSISDSALGNSSILISVGVNVSYNQTGELHLYLEYDNNSIEITKTATLESPSATVDFIFDNQSIKRTHHNGSYSISRIKIIDDFEQVD